MNTWKKIASYLSFRKQNSGENNVNLKLMHGINRISILMFLFALLVIIFRLVTK